MGWALRNCRGAQDETIRYVPYVKTELCLRNGNAFPLQAWSGPEGSRNLRLPDFVTTAQDGRLYPPENTPGTHFC